MKKVLFALVALFAFTTAVNAQNFIGVRGAFGSNHGGELSGQFGMGANRLELDLGWAGHDDWAYYNLSGIYQWTGTITGDFGWYAGVGANVGFWNHPNDGGEFGLGVLLQGGLEYNFPIPLQITLDVRPQWDFIGAASGFGYGLALGLRYRF